MPVTSEQLDVLFNKNDEPTTVAEVEIMLELLSDYNDDVQAALEIVSDDFISEVMAFGESHPDATQREVAMFEALKGIMSKMFKMAFITSLETVRSLNERGVDKASIAKSLDVITALWDDEEPGQGAKPSAP